MDHSMGYPWQIQKACPALTAWHDAAKVVHHMMRQDLLHEAAEGLAT